MPEPARLAFLETLTTDEMAALDAELSQHLRSDLLAWCRHVLRPLGFQPARHHRLIIRELEAITRGENRRLMLFLPPGSAKSTYASDLFPAWWLAQKPGRLVIAASNTADLATSFSRRVRGRIREHGDTLGFGLEREAEDNWTTTHRCEYRAVGVGSAVAGRRADLGLVDDPTRSREDADSLTQRNKVWNWYIDDFLTRLKPGAAQVLIGTRWHEDDLFGRILKHQPGEWRVLKIPAMADSEADPLGRKPGEYLWGDDAYGYAADLAEKKRTALPRTWASLYQQSPSVEGGQIIKADWWEPWIGPAPDPFYVLLSIDPAYTSKDENDPSACTVWYVIEGKDGRQAMLMRYAWAKRLEFPELVSEVIETWEHFAPKGVPCRILVENKASGISVVQEMRRRVENIPVWETPPKGDKVARAYAVQPAFEAGKVYAMANGDEDDWTWKPWAQTVIAECAAFPAGEHDDLMDSVSQALRHVRDLGIVLHPEDDPPPPPLRAGMKRPKLYAATGQG